LTIEPDDLNGILALEAGYCHSLDQGRWDDLAGLLMPDCVMHILGQDFVGREAVVLFLKGSARGKHIVSVPLIEFLKGGRATVEIDQIFIRLPDMVLMVAGMYRDDLVKTDSGEWKIKRREVIVNGTHPDITIVSSQKSRNPKED
jgi:SnoaL-like protein